jgi:hypothetical protein
MAGRRRYLGPRSDHQGQFLERDGHPPSLWLFDRQLIVAAPNVLDAEWELDERSGFSCR